MVQLLMHNSLSLNTILDHHMQFSGIVEKTKVQLHRHNWLSLKTLLDHDMQSSGIVEKDHGATISIIGLVLKLCWTMKCNLQELLNKAMVQRKA